MKKLYFASTLVYPENRQMNAEYAKQLEAKFKVYLPQRDGGLYHDLRKKMPYAKAAAQVFAADMKAIRECDVLVARLHKPDDGVFFEIGVAHALGKEVIAVFDGNPDVLNPMIWQGCRVFFNSNEFWRWFALV